MPINSSTGLTYTAGEFSSIFHRKTTFSLPAHHELRITGLDTESCQEPLGIRPDLRLNEIEKVFNQFLQQHNLEVDTLAPKGVFVYRVVEPGVISLVSDHSLELKIRYKTIIDRFFYFFYSNILERVSQFLYNPHLILTELSSEESQFLMSDSSPTCEELRNQLVKVPSKMFKRLIANLSQFERKELLRCMDRSNHEERLNIYGRVLQVRMQHLNELPIHYAKRHGDFSILFKLIKKIRRLVDIICSRMGFLTLKNTYALARKSICLDTASQIPVNRSQIPERRCSARRLERIIKQELQHQPGERIDLKAVLTQRGYSSVIANCSLRDNEILCRVNLEGMTFINCKLDWFHLMRASLNHVTFHSCKLFNVSFVNAVIKNSSFINCQIREAMFTNAQLENVRFVSSSILGSSFEDAHLTNTVFDHVRMGATHFCQAKVEESRFAASCVRDTVFFGTLDDFDLDDVTRETATVSAPVVGIVVHPTTRGITTPKVYHKLAHAAHVIPIRITAQNQKVNIANVNQQVAGILNEVVPLHERGQLPIPQQLLERIQENQEEFSESFRILKKAKVLTSEVDAFFLPGGEDIPPYLYGQEANEQTDWNNDYRRSLLELGIISQAFNKGIPLMGVCRGFQMANIYFGAELEQHVPDQKGLQRFTLLEEARSGIYGEVIGDSIMSAVFHHQAVPQDRGPTQVLRPSVIYKNWIKAVERVDSQAAPMILLQFHPEFYRTSSTAKSIVLKIQQKALSFIMSSSNDHFWKLLSDNAQVHRTKKQFRFTLKQHLLTLRSRVGR